MAGEELTRLPFIIRIGGLGPRAEARVFKAYERGAVDYTIAEK
jgi:hypothetical protein